MKLGINSGYRGLLVRVGSFRIWLRSGFELEGTISSLSFKLVRRSSLSERFRISLLPCTGLCLLSQPKRYSLSFSAETTIELQQMLPCSYRFWWEGLSWWVKGWNWTIMLDQTRALFRWNLVWGRRCENSFWVNFSYSWQLPSQFVWRGFVQVQRWHPEQPCQEVDLECPKVFPIWQK